MYGYGGPRRRWPWAILVAMVVLVAVVVVVVVLALTGAFGATTGRPLFGVWGGLLLLFLILWVAFFAVRMVFWSRRIRYGPGRGYARLDPAVMAARQRYARGQITREQYDQIMADLERRRPPP